MDFLVEEAEAQLATAKAELAAAKAERSAAKTELAAAKAELATAKAELASNKAELATNKAELVVYDAVRKAIKAVGERGNISIGYRIEKGDISIDEILEAFNEKVQAYVGGVSESQIYRVICKYYPHLRLRNPAGMLSRENVFVYKTCGSKYCDGRHCAMCRHGNILVVKFYHPWIEKERLSNFQIVSDTTKEMVVEWFGGKLTKEELFK